MEILLTEFMTKPLWMWGVFLSLVSGLLYFDLAVLNRKDHVIGVKESLTLSGFYMSVGLTFGGFIWWQMGGEPALKYVTGFVIEQSLSMDNIFVMAMILGYFNVPLMFQHRVLFWGIMGVILLRGIMIAAGAALIEEYHWVLYVFAVFLIVTGVKMLMHDDDGPKDIGKNPVLVFLKQHLRLTHSIHSHDFLVRQEDERTGKLAWHATPLLLALVLIELADVVFAVDSVPAIFAITTDPYLVFSSNIFAVMGLRSLYFALAAMLDRFAYLKYALSLVLVFIGGKMLAAHYIEIPAAFSLGMTLIILASGFGYSLWKTRK